MNRKAEDRLANHGNDVPPIPEAVISAAREGAERLEATRTRKVRHRALVAGGLGLALLGASFTPPGRAATDWVADLAGVGDEPSLEQVGSVDGSEVVVASGTLSDGTRYEAVIKRITDESRSEDFGSTPGTEIPDAVCVQIDWPDFNETGGGGNCAGGKEKLGLDESWAHQFEVPHNEFGSPMLFFGFVGNEQVADVEIEQTEPTRIPVETQFIPIEGDLRERLGSDFPSAVFIAELDGEIVAGGAENQSVVVATALDESGMNRGTAQVEGPFNCPLNFVKLPPPPPAGSPEPEPTATFGGGERPEFECGEPIPKGPPPVTQFRLDEGAVPPDLVAATDDLGLAVEQADTKARAPFYEPGSGLVSVDVAAETTMRRVPKVETSGPAGGGGLVFDLDVYAAINGENGGLLYVVPYTAKRFTGKNAPSQESLGLPRTYLAVVEAATGDLVAFGAVD